MVYCGCFSVSLTHFTKANAELTYRWGSRALLQLRFIWERHQVPGVQHFYTWGWEVCRGHFTQFHDLPKGPHIKQNSDSSSNKSFLKSWSYLDCRYSSFPRFCFNNVNTSPQDGALLTPYIWVCSLVCDCTPKWLEWYCCILFNLSCQIIRLSPQHSVRIG